eukprot:Nk52_evm1s2466 gene=Nk52_evmTU1s2466
MSEKEKCKVCKLSFEIFHETSSCAKCSEKIHSCCGIAILEDVQCLQCIQDEYEKFNIAAREEYLRAKNKGKGTVRLREVRLRSDEPGTCIICGYHGTQHRCSACGNTVHNLCAAPPEEDVNIALETLRTIGPPAHLCAICKVRRLNERFLNRPVSGASMLKKATKKTTKKTTATKETAPQKNTKKAAAKKDKPTLKLTVRGGKIFAKGNLNCKTSERKRDEREGVLEKDHFVSREDRFPTRVDKLFPGDELLKMMGIDSWEDVTEPAKLIIQNCDSLITYNPRIKKYIDWCKNHDKHGTNAFPTLVTEGKLIEFLKSLKSSGYEERRCRLSNVPAGTLHYRCSTIKGYAHA